MLSLFPGSPYPVAQKLSVCIILWALLLIGDMISLYVMSACHDLEDPEWREDCEMARDTWVISAVITLVFAVAVNWALLASCLMAKPDVFPHKWRLVVMFCVIGGAIAQTVRSVIFFNTEFLEIDGGLRLGEAVIIAAEAVLLQLLPREVKKQQDQDAAKAAQPPTGPGDAKADDIPGPDGKTAEAPPNVIQVVVGRTVQEP